jgi:hypothetical protein
MPVAEIFTIVAGQRSAIVPAQITSTPATSLLFVDPNLLFVDHAFFCRGLDVTFACISISTVNPIHLCHISNDESNSTNINSSIDSCIPFCHGATAG